MLTQLERELLAALSSFYRAFVVEQHCTDTALAETAWVVIARAEKQRDLEETHPGPYSRAELLDWVAEQENPADVHRRNVYQ